MFVLFVVKWFYYHLFQEGKPRDEEPYDFTLFHEDELDDQAVKQLNEGDDKNFKIALGDGRKYALDDSKAMHKTTAGILAVLQDRATEADEAIRVLLRKHVKMKGELLRQTRHNEANNEQLLAAQDEKEAAENTLVNKEAELSKEIARREAAENTLVYKEAELSKEIAGREAAENTLVNKEAELSKEVARREAAENALVFKEAELSKEIAGRETAENTLVYKEAELSKEIAATIEEKEIAVKEAELAKDLDQVVGKLSELGGVKELAEEEQMVADPPVDKLEELGEHEDKEADFAKEENIGSETTVDVLNMNRQLSSSGSFGLTITDVFELLLPLFGGPNNRREDPFAAQNAGQELALLCSGLRSQEELLKLPTTDSFRKFRTRFCKAQGILGENGFRVFEQNKNELVTLRSKLWIVQKDKLNTEASLEFYRKKMQNCDCDLRAKKIAERRRQRISEEQERRASKRRRGEESGGRDRKRQKGEVNSGREDKARRWK